MRPQFAYGALSALALIASCGTLQAADLGQPYPPFYPKAPSYEPTSIVSWSGFYAGINAGWGRSKGSGQITIGGFTGPTSGSGKGFLGGAQVGYNWQAGSIVYGAEADIQASGGNGTVTGVAGPAFFTATAKTPWFGTARGRIGYSFGRWLPYVTAGGVVESSRLRGVLNTTGPFSTSTTSWTWTAGAGIEAALWQQWSVKGEYLYLGTPNKIPVPPGTTSASGSTNTHVLRVGLNYRM